MKDINGRNLKYWRKTCFSGTLSIINTIWTVLESKSGLSNEKPVTK